MSAPNYQPIGEKAKTALTLAHDTSAFITAFEGSVRTGKTIALIFAWIRFIRTGPEGRLAMIGRTEKTVINNMVLPMQQMLGRKRVVVNRAMGTVTVCGRVVEIFGANDEAARTKIQGATLAGALVDEAAEIPESFFNMLVTRFSVEGARLYLSCNPAGPKHWLKTKWLDRAAVWVKGDGTVEYAEDTPDMGPSEKPLELVRATFILDDNKENLPPGYIERIKASYSGVFYRRMILGEWAAADGLVYEDFNSEKHVIKHDDLPTMERVLSLGLDYGSRKNARGILLGMATVEGVTRLYAIDEWNPPNLTVGQHSQHLLNWMGERPEPEYIAYDPAAKVFGDQLYADGLTNVTTAENGVLDGIRTVDTLIASDRLHISDRCTGLLDELPGYVWDPRAAEHGEDKVLKQNDHSCDALRYAVYTVRELWQPHINLITSKEAA